MNKIDRKYKQAAEYPTKTQLYLADKALLKYLHSYPNQQTKNEVLKYWPELYSQYNIGNDECVLYRGMCFLKKDLSTCYKLLSKISSTRAFASNSIRSWTTLQSVADNFAYFYEGSNKLIIEPRNCFAGFVISSACYEDEGLDLREYSRLNSSFGTEEYEIIMPPGSFECIVISAVLLIDSTYYLYTKYSSSENARLIRALNQACDRQNKTLYGDESKYSIMQVPDLDMFLSYLKRAL